MTEKDRFGDKLRDKEKAEEDRYFAEQDRAKLEALRSDKQAVEALGLCPRCSVKLEPQKSHNVTIDLCPSCNGIWLDKGELEEIMQRENEPWFSRLIRDVLGTD